MVEDFQKLIRKFEFIYYSILIQILLYFMTIY
jgi:hypothetical protein